MVKGECILVGTIDVRERYITWNILTQILTNTIIKFLLKTKPGIISGFFNLFANPQVKPAANKSLSPSG